MDEIYGLSVFDEESRFDSVLSLEEFHTRENVHFVWGFSKVETFLLHL